MHLQNVVRHRQLALRWVVEDHQEAREAATEDLLLHDVPFNSSADTASLLADPR